MKTYSISITPDAEADLWAVRNYIADTLKAPDTALDYILAIRNEIAKLEYIASTIAPVLDEPWHSRKIRRIPSKGFFVYYRIDEDNDIVYVMNIIYQKSDQIKILQRY